MVETTMDIQSWLRKQLEQASPDLLRAMVQEFAEALMGAEADALCGAAYGERSPERVNRRNGHRERDWDTRVGDTRVGSIELAVPSCARARTSRAGCCSPAGRAEQAFVSVIADACSVASARRSASRACSMSTSQAPSGAPRSSCRSSSSRASSSRCAPASGRRDSPGAGRDLTPQIRLGFVCVVRSSRANLCAQSAPIRPRNRSLREAGSEASRRRNPSSQANSRHIGGPAATPLRSPWRFKSSHPHSPKWSPDGRWIAYTSDRSKPGNAEASEIYVVRPNGAGFRRMTRDRWGDDQLAWAPDGKRFVFVSRRPGSRSGICVMNVNGSGFRRLTDNGYLPAWAPGGGTIAFERLSRITDDFVTDAIWLMDSDGSNQRRLTEPPQSLHSRGRDGEPGWSPDGRLIAFARSFRGRRDIYVIRPDGDGLRRLTKQAGLHSFPAWSPDGKRIVFVTSIGRRRGIYVMNADGTGVRLLTTGHREYAYPDWQPAR